MGNCDVDQSVYGKLYARKDGRFTYALDTGKWRCYSEARLNSAAADQNPTVILTGLSTVVFPKKAILC